jgi:hypothetical protein
MSVIKEADTLLRSMPRTLVAEALRRQPDNALQHSKK